ncbi:MAG: hypothetical protein AB7G06_04075 [Bdellovibrionales bacterium]
MSNPLKKLELRKVLLVGGISDAVPFSPHTQLSSTDSERLRVSCLDIQGYGIPIDDTYGPEGWLDYTIINIDPEQGGRDFLNSPESELTCDILSVCNIAGFYVNDHSHLKQPPNGAPYKGTSMDRRLFVSPHHDAERWRSAILKTGAKIVIFEGDLSPSNIGMDQTGYILIGTGFSTDISYYYIHPDYLKEMVPHLPENSSLRAIPQKAKL